MSKETKYEVTEDYYLQQLPDSPKPDIKAFDFTSGFEADRIANRSRLSFMIDAWNEELKSLPKYKIPQHYHHLVTVGQEMQEGKDFELHTQPVEGWQPTYNNPDDPPTETFAVPVTQKEENRLRDIGKQVGLSDYHEQDEDRGEKEEPKQEEAHDEVYEITDVEKLQELLIEAKKNSYQWCKKAMELSSTLRAAADSKLFSREFVIGFTKWANEEYFKRGNTDFWYSGDPDERASDLTTSQLIDLFIKTKTP
jgi:hypothetical protein